MGNRQVQTIVGWIMVLGHFGICAFIIGYKHDTWSAEVKQSALLALSPVTVAYVVAIVKAWVDGKHLVGAGRIVNMNFVLIAILLPSLLLIFLFYTVYRFPGPDFVKPEQLQQWLAAGEVAMGGAVAYIMTDLFGDKEGR